VLAFVFQYLFSSWTSTLLETLNTGSSDALVDSRGIIAGTGVRRQGLSRMVIHVRRVSVSAVEEMEVEDEQPALMA
jgi:hypothetical protein